MQPGPDAAWRRTNVGHLLFAATGKCIAAKLAVVHDAGFAGISDAQLALFGNLDEDGARLTVLAARAGLTKQGMIELIDRAERRGLVQRRRDADDRRAKVVALTRRGRELRRAAGRGAVAAERAFASAVGETNVEAIRRALSALAPEIGDGAGTERMLAVAAGHFVGDVLGAVHAEGYREVTEALLMLFRTLELEGSRLTEIAAAARVTKQSMRMLVDSGETLALIERAPDPVDGRAKLIRFSAAGLVMLDAMRRGVAAAEARFVRVAGDATVDDLKAWLGGYLAAP